MATFLHDQKTPETAGVYKVKLCLMDYECSYSLSQHLYSGATTRAIILPTPQTPLNIFWFLLQMYFKLMCYPPESFFGNQVK